MTALDVHRHPPSESPPELKPVQPSSHVHRSGMAHDMSDPQMAKAMEQDMRTRFFVALALTIPTILFSPMAMNMFGLMLVPSRFANWLAFAFAAPVVWWAGWVFISGSYHALRNRTLDMSVLIA